MLMYWIDESEKNNNKKLWKQKNQEGLLSWKTKEEFQEKQEKFKKMCFVVASLHDGPQWSWLSQSCSRIGLCDQENTTEVITFLF